MALAGSVAHANRDWGRPNQRERRVGSDAAQMMKYVVCIASRGGGAVARQSIWKSHTSARKDRLSSSSSSAACTARGRRLRGCRARGVEM